MVISNKINQNYLHCLSFAQKQKSSNCQKSIQWHCVPCSKPTIFRNTLTVAENYMHKLGFYQVNNAITWASALQQIYYNQKYAGLLIYMDV